MESNLASEESFFSETRQFLQQDRYCGDNDGASISSSMVGTNSEENDEFDKELEQLQQRREGNRYFDDGLFIGGPNFLLEEESNDIWARYVDNTFALGFFGKQNLPMSFTTAKPPLCDHCRGIDFCSDEFKLPELMVESCALCNLFQHSFRLSVRPQGSDLVKRDKSSLSLDGHDRPALSICAERGSRDVPEYIQIGFPALPAQNDPVYYNLLREWLQVCDKHHKCYTEPNAPLPTRVIDVGDVENTNALRLYCPSRDERGRYIAMSHCWGKLQDSEKNKFCTYECNIKQKLKNIHWDSMPASFQHAVTVTRKLGIRYIWIDSICIIQPHGGCTAECGRFKDWSLEAGNMEKYYSLAYCTIAATSAKDSTQGFLNPRQARHHVRVESASAGCSLYVCEAIDDFRNHVEKATLNTRGWVLQERVLSRRTIHFTNTQTYWECGRGVHCETLTRMNNVRSSFLADPEFPQGFLGYNSEPRIRLFQVLFEEYSRRGLTQLTDKSVAISSMNERLASFFDTKVHYGVFERFFHRGLLWQRSSDGQMQRIAYSSHQKVPSWSWMAYEGPISFMSIRFNRVEWSSTVEFRVVHISSIFASLEKGPPKVELWGLARSFSLDENERKLLIFDEDDKNDLRKLRCIIVGREPLEEPSDTQQHFVLLVRLIAGGNDHERVGVGCVQKRHINWGLPASQVLVI